MPFLVLLGRERTHQAQVFAEDWYALYPPAEEDFAAAFALFQEGRITF